MTPPWAAIPVKAFAGAKQRLSPLLTPGQRQALATAMLEDVLRALAAAPLAGVLVNTIDPTAMALARRFGARIISEQAESGHTAAVAAMATRLARERVHAMLTVPGDIPRVTVAEIRTLCCSGRTTPSFTIVPARDERGSNAVLLEPPVAVPLRFGEDSFFPHLEAARSHGIDPVILMLPGIGLDIDHPGDVQALLHATPALNTATERLLAEFGLSAR